MGKRKVTVTAAQYHKHIRMLVVAFATGDFVMLDMNDKGTLVHSLSISKQVSGRSIIFIYSFILQDRKQLSCMKNCKRKHERPLILLLQIMFSRIIVCFSPTSMAKCILHIVALGVIYCYMLFLTPLLLIYRAHTLSA